MAMRPSTVKRALGEARRFIETAILADQRVPREHKLDSYQYREGGRYIAALRRASMDLTRVLADLRAGR